MLRPLCIFHGSDCMDGATSAWVVHRALGDEVDFWRATYGEKPPLNRSIDRDVIIVDFSYPLADLEALAATAHSVIVLDHHKSAQEALSGLPELISAYSSLSSSWPKAMNREHRPLALFDMNRSGAGLTWDFFNPHEPRPQLVNLVEDYDLWRFNHDWTRAVHAAMKSHPFDFALWDQWATSPGLNGLYAEGVALLRKHQKDVEQIVAIARQEMIIGGVKVPIVNAPPWLASDVGHVLGEGAPFAGTYYDRKDKRVFSLRSRPDGMDVSKVAGLYGGGGHRGAGGFAAAPGWSGENEPIIEEGGVDAVPGEPADSGAGPAK